MPFRTKAEISGERVKAAAQRIREYYTGEMGFPIKDFNRWIDENKFDRWDYYHGWEKLKREGFVDKVNDRYYVLKEPRCCPTCKRPFPPGKGRGIKVD